MTRIGIGYDVHRMETGRRCVIGGVEIPHPLGPLGYSDADVLLHALCDALLGAAGLGDLGRYFPEGEPRWKGIGSLALLEEVARMLTARGAGVVNIDAVVVAEAPKIAPHVEQMKKNIAGPLHVLPSAINIKATGTDRIGFVGRGEGIAAQVVCLLEMENATLAS
jgi:2-C-methyl-D-erythritol 2,4-cyclodiphosphate synthase